MTEQNMAARLAKIMGDVGRVEKKGRITSKGDGPSYKFAKDSDVLEAVTPKMAEEGIVLIPETQELLSMEPTMSGRQMIANIKTGWHVTDGKESLRFETFGQGADSGDKALPKAQSNARKYAFFMLYHIVTGDDPDQHASEQPERVSGGQRSVGAAPSSQGGSASASAPAPAPRNKGEALGFLAEVMHAHNMNFAAVDAIAKRQGIERGTATVQEIVDLIAAIEQPSSVPTPADGEGESSAPLPTDTAQAGEVALPPGDTQPAPATEALLDEAERIAEAPAKVARTVEEAIADAEAKAAKPKVPA